MAAESMTENQTNSGVPEAETPKPEDTAEAFRQQIEELRAALKQKDGEIRALKVGAAVDMALTKAGAKNLTAVKALIGGLDEMMLSEDGSIADLEEKISAIKSSDGYLFEQRGGKLSIRGAKPEESSGEPNVDISGMTYSQLTEYIGKNPDAKIFG